jgi:phosphatidylserine/phosphatidylglycerophosphate/cardiolipin synthase-like enzyme
VQVLRTYPAKRPRYPFAPHGERSIARAYQRAFARARHLVYVEDQYFWSTAVTRALADALRREPALQVIAVVPRYPEQDSAVSGTPMRLGQQRARDLLTEAGGDRFAMYDLQNAVGTPVYVHAKVCVVDDTWMSCGSDNLNVRSWSHDSEVACAVVDTDGALPRSLRTSLWAEHLGLPADDPRLADLDGATRLWAARAAEPGSRVRAHDLPRVRRGVAAWAGPAYRLVFDPDGRPRGLRGTDRF